MEISIKIQENEEMWGVLKGFLVFSEGNVDFHG
jgi:small nuclear ribonucleoprotein (snRNP)-like protein